MCLLPGYGGLLRPFAAQFWSPFPSSGISLENIWCTHVYYNYAPYFPYKYVGMLQNSQSVSGS